MVLILSKPPLVALDKKIYREDAEDTKVHRSPAPQLTYVGFIWRASCADSFRFVISVVSWWNLPFFRHVNRVACSSEANANRRNTRKFSPAAA